MKDIPNWIYDLVIELIEQQEVHPTLLYKAGGMKEIQQYDWCSCVALNRVPDEIVEKAKAIRDYRKQIEADYNRSIVTLEELMRNLGFSQGSIEQTKSEAEMIKIAKE